jgi:transposase
MWRRKNGSAPLYGRKEVLGLIPSEDSSAGKQRHGHLRTQGNRLLQFLLVEAAQAAGIAFC